MDRMLATYTLEEVAKHNTVMDCWVIVNNAVIDVTNFLNEHPGGANAIAKAGRAGTDVTAAFEQIGHTSRAMALLNSLQIGVVAGAADCNLEDVETTLLLRGSKPSGEENVEDSLREAAPLWHAKRRKAILRDHPEVAELIGSNPWTCVIGLATVFIHCATSIYVQRPEVSWWFMFLLAYTVGALCKMFQFAVNHDICHGTAGSWLVSSELLKRTMMQLCTLPCIGGTTHIYYENQHMGHHFALGTLSFIDLFPQQRKDGSGALVFENMKKWLFFPESDGDMLAIGNFAYGRILKKWGGVRSDSDPHTKEERREYYQNESLESFHRIRYYKILAMQVLYVAHHAFFSLAVICSMAPIIPVVSIPAFLFPDFVCDSLIALLNNNARLKAELSKISTHELEKFLIPFVVKSCASQGLHLWNWIGLNIYLFFYAVDTWTWGGLFRGILYLYLSELFVFGFLLHPYMGYFLGVHRSGGDGFRSKNEQIKAENECQPTMSTYGCLSALCSMNLTHHVEHHDFPSVPWNRLPEITRLAPEYYEDLEQSSSFVYTIFQWFDHSKGWSYGCH